MNIKVFRYSSGKDSTLGVMLIDGKFAADTLEDEYRAQKVHGETRIPARTYEVKFREELTGLTQTYRAKYDWFNWHLHIQNVPGFKWVYIHIGNSDDDTEGCLLVGQKASNNDLQEGRISQSRITFKRVYQKISAALQRGEKATIQFVELDNYFEK